jgi:hypothetical protein
MSKRARTLILGVALAAMNLAGLTAVAQAQPTGDDAVELFRRGERASLEQPTSGSVQRAAEAQERYHSTWRYGDPLAEQGLAQERYYSTWGYGDTPAPVSAQPSNQPDWLVPVIGVLAAALALLGVLAALLVRRSRGRVRVRQVA